MTRLRANLPTCSNSLIPFSSRQSCSSRSSSGTGALLMSISLSRALPADAILPWRRAVTRLPKCAASRDRSSANLNRALRENAAEFTFTDESEFAEAKELIEPRLARGYSSLVELSYMEVFHRARFVMNCVKSSIIMRRSTQAADRCSSHVNRVPRSSRDSERSRSSCNNLSRAKMVVSVNSITSVSAGDKFLCVAA